MSNIYTISITDENADRLAALATAASMNEAEYLISLITAAWEASNG